MFEVISQIWHKGICPNLRNIILMIENYYPSHKIITFCILEYVTITNDTSIFHTLQFRRSHYNIILISINYANLTHNMWWEGLSWNVISYSVYYFITNIRSLSSILGSKDNKNGILANSSIHVLVVIMYSEYCSVYSNTFSNHLGFVPLISIVLLQPLDTVKRIQQLTSKCYFSQHKMELWYCILKM